MSFDLASSQMDVSLHNVSSNCASTEPRLWEFWQAVPRFVIALQATGWVVALLTVLLALVQFRYIFKYVSLHRRATLLAWLVSTFPTLSLCYAVGLLVPKANHLVTILVSLIYASNIFTFVQMIFNIFGGREQFYSALEGTPMKLRSGLFSCCVCIMPSVFTKFSIDVLCWMIYQHAIVRTTRNVIYTILEVGGIVGTFSLKEQPFVWIGVIISLVSTIMAMYSCSVLNRHLWPSCQPYCTRMMFGCFAILLALFNFQRFIYDVVAIFTGPSCYNNLTPATLIRFYYNFGFIMELLILSLLVTVVMRAHRCALFDKHPARAGRDADISAGEGVAVDSSRSVGNNASYPSDKPPIMEEITLDQADQQPLPLDKKQQPISDVDLRNHVVSPVQLANPTPAWGE